RYLLLDMSGEVVGILEAHSACVDQFEKPVVVAHQVGQPVASAARPVVDNGDGAPSEPVEHTALADVRAADNHNLRDGHGSKLSITRETSATTPRTLYSK